MMCPTSCRTCKRVRTCYFLALLLPIAGIRVFFFFVLPTARLRDHELYVALQETWSCYCVCSLAINRYFYPIDIRRT